jgi:hypothetical protein
MQPMCAGLAGALLLLAAGEETSPPLVRGAWIRAFRAGGTAEAAKALEEGTALLPEAARPPFDVDRSLLERMKGVFASLPTRVKAGEKLPGALGKTTRLKGDVLAVDEEGFTLKEAREEKRIPWSGLAKRDLADFVSAREPRNARDLFDAAALRLLDGDADRAWKGLQQVRTAFAAEPEAALASSVLEARTPLEAGLREAKALAAFRSVPEDASGAPLLAAVRAAFTDPEVLASEAYGKGREGLAPRVSTALEGEYAREGVKSAFRGTVELAEGGRVSLRYAFERVEEAGDWILEPYASVRSGAWGGFDPKIDAAKVQDWGVREGGLFAAGRASARHVAQFTGEVSVKLSFKVTTLDKVGPKEVVIYLLLAGILDDRKGTFVCSPGGTNLVRVKKGDLAQLPTSGSIPPVPPFGKVHEMKIEWKGGKLFAALGGKTTIEAAFTGAPDKPGQAAQTGGTVFLWLEGPVLARVDDVVVEGTLDPAWVESSKKDWVAKQLLQALPAASK